MKKYGWFLSGMTAVLGAAVYQLIEHGVPVRREYEVIVPEELSGLRMVFLSDLHCNPLICNNRRVLRQIAAEQPDVIVLAGDMISKYGRKENDRVPDFLEKLTGIAPVVYSMGNHEEVLRTEKPEQFAGYAEKIKKAGIFLLDNESVSLVLQGKNIDFAGLTLKREYYYKRVRRPLPEEALKSLNILHRSQTILLAHMPDFFSEYTSLAPLVLSGHIHGGIIRLPFVGGILSPQLYFPPYTRGCYSKGNSTLVVNAGIGSHSLPARLFNRIEYCVINTKSRKLV